MCDPVTIGVVTMAVATVAQGQQAKQQGKYANKVAKFNARQTENQATRTRNMGTERENARRQKTAALLSQQRAQLGAANVDIGSGSALQLQEDTLTLGDVDALRIRQNFLDQAEQQDLQASLIRSEGKAKEKAGRAAFRTSLLKAGGMFLSSGVSDKWFTPESAAVTEGATGVEFATGGGINTRITPNEATAMYGGMA
jgi:hypothetical protein